MTLTRFERFLPWSGLPAGLLFGASFLATGGAPSLDGDDPGPTVAWALSHQGRLALSAVAGALFVFFMLMFVASLRAAVRSGEAAESNYSSVVQAGGIGVALSVGTMALLSLSLSSADEQAAHTLVYLSDVAWLPWAACSGVFLLATGLGALKTLALPKWLGITTAVLGVLSIAGPGGVLVFLVSPLWLVVTSVVLARRQSSAAPLHAGAPAFA